MSPQVHRGVFTALLFIAIAAPVLLPSLPAGIVGMSALLGALVILQRTGALRERYLVLLILAALAAVAFGIFRKGVW